MTTPEESINQDMAAAMARLKGQRVETAEIIVQADGSQWLQLVGANWHATISAVQGEDAPPPLYVAFLDGRETLVPGPEATVTEVAALQGAVLNEVTASEVTASKSGAAPVVQLRIQGGNTVLVRVDTQAGNALQVLAR